MDLPNLQGASLRQMIATGDQTAALLQAGKHPGSESQAKFGQLMVEKALRAQDQTESNEMVVKRQEDNAQFTTGDSLNGGGGGGGGSQGEARSSHDGDSLFDESELHSGLECVEDPFGVADRFRSGLLAGGRELGERHFRPLDRKGLAGLIDHPADGS